MNADTPASSEPDSPGGSADEAVRRLFDTHGAQLYQLAVRFCGDAREAEDLVQEVFLNVFRSWKNFRGEASEKSWLYRIAARACQRMHRLRAGEPKKIESLEALLPFGETLVGVIPSDESDAVKQAIRKEARAELEAAIVELPDDFRVPLILKEIVGFSVREVADILGLEEGTVRSRLHRARLKLRAAIDSTIPRNPTPAPPPAYDRQPPSTPRSNSASPVVPPSASSASSNRSRSSCGPATPRPRSSKRRRSGVRG